MNCVCIDCQEVRPHKARGLCQTCYKRWQRGEREPTGHERLIEGVLLCKQCHEPRSKWSELCNDCLGSIRLRALANREAGTNVSL